MAKKERKTKSSGSSSGGNGSKKGSAKIRVRNRVEKDDPFKPIKTNHPKGYVPF